VLVFVPTPVSFRHRLVILQHTCLFLFYVIKRCKRVMHASKFLLSLCIDSFLCRPSSRIIWGFHYLWSLTLAITAVR